MKKHLDLIKPLHLSSIYDHLKLDEGSDNLEMPFV